MESIKPLFPSNTSRGPVMPRMARKVAWVQPKGSIGIGQTFPVGQGSGSGNPQGIEGRPADGNRIRRTDLIQTQRLGDACGDGIGTLCGMVKTFGPDGGHVAQTALDLVSHRQSD